MKRARTIAVETVYLAVLFSLSVLFFSDALHRLHPHTSRCCEGATHSAATVRR